MGKYQVVIGDSDREGESIEADFLPKEGEEYLYDDKIYHVEKIKHKIVRKDGRLEAKVEIHLR